jgi:hypothetical protein
MRVVICLGVQNEIVYDKSRELMEDLAVEAFKTLLVRSLPPLYIFCTIMHRIILR